MSWTKAGIVEDSVFCRSLKAIKIRYPHLGMHFRILVVSILFVTKLASANVSNEADRFGIALVNENPTFNLLLRPNVEQDTNSKIDYEPNVQNLSGFQVSAKGFTIAYLTRNEITDDQEEKFGKTSYEDIRASLFIGREDQYYLTGYYTRYKGFYIDNSSEIDGRSSSDNKIQRPDLSTFNFGASVLYVFSPNNFSAAAPISQSARQTSSGGSWLAMGSIDSNIISADTALVPSEVQSEYGEDASITEGKFGTLGASGGYGYTLTYNGFYLSLMGLIGKGLQTREYEVSGEKQSSTTNVDKFFWLGSLGINRETFYLAWTLSSDTTSYETNSILFESTVITQRFALGLRF